MNAPSKTRCLVLLGAAALVTIGLTASSAQADYYGGHDFGHYGGHGFDHGYDHFDYGHYGHYDHDIHVVHHAPHVRYISQPYTYDAWEYDCHGHRYLVHKTGYRRVAVTY